MRILLLLAATLACCHAAIQMEGDRPLVVLRQGRALGEMSSRLGVSFARFRGIPFAKPPVGDLRFEDPLPADPWEGTFDARPASRECPQMNSEALITQNYEPVGDEDCLLLNVYTPEAAKDEWAKLPVMVFIHGGGFVSGSGVIYENNTFVTEGVIFVSIHYRLGALGFFSTGDDLVPGNYGLKDQVMALQWIQENIAEFGGDPHSVTIFGESAGGASVHYMTLAPSANGLFSRAIIQSGTAFASWATGAKFKNNLIPFATMLECPDSEDAKSAIECLKKTDASKIVEMFGALQIKSGVYQVVYGPRIDGDFLPAHPAILSRFGAHAKVPTMIGTTKDEGMLFALFMFLTPNITTKFENEFDILGPITLGIEDEPNGVEKAKKAYEHYLGTTKYTHELAHKYGRMASDFAFDVGTDIVAEQISGRVPVYLYSFDYRGENSFGDPFLSVLEKAGFNFDISKDVMHADEIQYMFDISWLQLKTIKSEEDLRMRERVVKLWTNFAITGNPTPDGSLGTTWAPVNKDNLWHLSIDSTLKMKPDFRFSNREFVASLNLEKFEFVGPPVNYDESVKLGENAGVVHNEL